MADALPWWQYRAYKEAAFEAAGIETGAPAEVSNDASAIGIQVRRV